MKSPRNSLKAKDRLGSLIGWIIVGLAVNATGQVVVDPNAGADNLPVLDQAPNGVPIVQIATPNANGLSHNLYQDYNVGSGGLILNNISGKYGESQLGGVIFGNANLKNGSASTILNEITGIKRTELLGFTEVAGQSAHVIVANPNGIYINGAGFINTPRVSLTTGKPEMDASGALIAYRVEQGNILVEGAGLNAMDTDAFDLISRTASFAADLHVRGEMRVVAGRNRVNADDLDAAELADDGSEKPVVAIDSSQLGGMYAGKIKLLATEKGVGVNMQGAAAASAGDLIAQAKGDVKVRKASASAGKVRIQSDEGNTEVTEQVAATGKVELQSQTGEVRIAAGAQVASAEALLLEAGNAVRIETGGIASSHGKIDVSTARLSNDGELVAGTQLNLVLSGDVENAGILGADQHVSLVAANLKNSNRILSNETLDFQLASSLKNAGQIQAQSFLSGAVAGNTTNYVDGLIQSGKILTWETGSLQNEGRVLAGESAVIETASALVNSGKIAAQNDLSIAAGNLENRSELLSLGALQLRISGDLVNAAVIEAVDLDAEIGGTTTNQSGATLSTGQSLLWTAGGVFSNAGDVVSEASAVITAAQGIDNLTGGQFHAETLLSLETSELVQNSGTLSSTSDLRVTAQNLVNPYGQLIFAGNNLILSVAQDVNNAGTLFAGNALVVGVDGSLINTGNLLATGDIFVQNRAGTGRATAIVNSSATIDSRNGNILLRGERIENKRTELVIERDAVDLGLGEIEVINNFQFPLIYGTWNVTNAYDIPESFWEDAPYEEFRFSKYYGKRPIEERTNNLYVQEHRYEDVVIADSGAATIRAGKDIIFDADTILNQSSLVSAARDIEIQSGSLTNEGDALLNRVDTISRQEYFVVKLKEKYSGRDRWKREIIAGTEVSDVHYETAQSFSATLEAGGTIRGTIHALENSDVRAGTTVDPGTGIIPSFIRPDENPPSSLGTDLDTSLNFLGSLSQLLIENTDSQAKYLYETREEFSRLGYFLGSDYFFDHLGLETGATEKLLKRLGDAYFETQYVLRQLYELTGRTFLGAPETDFALMQRLMDNGIASARDLQLTPGIALTKEQFNRLDQDIIWMEERIVNGQRVMVPVVYLAPSTLKELGKSSATIAATNIDLKTGSLVNSGTFAAKEILKLDTQSLLNFGGSLLSEGSLLVSSAGDIINRSGTISGSSVGLFAGGNILNTTDSVQRIDGTGALANRHTQFGNTGSISSTGDLALKADGDIRNLGADLSTKGNATLQAGQDIEIGGIAATSEIHVRGPGMTLDLNQTGHLGSQLDIGKNLTLSAGRDVTLAGADVAVGGDATLAAGRDLSITTLTDTLQASGMVKGAGVKCSTATDRTTEIGTLLTTGGNLTLASGNDLTVRGSEIESSGDMGLIAGGDVDVLAGWEHESISTLKKSKSGGLITRNSKSATYNEDDSVIQSELVAGGDLSIQSGGMATLEAAKVRADNDLSIAAQGGIDLTAATATSLEQQKKSTTSVLSKSKFNSTETWSSDIGTTLEAGNNLTLGTDGNIDTEAASVTAGNNLSVQATGTLTAEEGRSTHTKDTASKSSGFGITHTTTSTGASSTTGYTSSKEKTHLAEDYSILGTWEAGNNSVLLSGDDLTLQGQQVGAGNILTVGSAGNIEILAANDHSESSFKKEDFSVGKTTNLQVTGLIVDTLAAADQSGDRDDGTNAMQAAVTARAAYNVIASQGTGLIGISLSESVGYTKSEQSGSSLSDTAAASSLTAGEILDVVAGKNITVIGSDLAGKQVNLDAAENIFLHSQKEITNDGHKENSSNASVGAVAYVQLGGPTGVAYGVNITANFGTSEGKGNTDTLAHRETTVTGSEGIAITSGNNTELIGALVFGETVKLDAGGNLIIRSEQDVYDTSEKSQSAGVNVSIPLPIPGTIPASMSMGGNYQDQNASAHIQTVQEQTGIYAGAGGYTINVGNQTTLTGGVISSEADAKLNHLTTGSLVLEDLKNTSEWNAETTGFSGNFSKQVNAKEGDPVIPSQASASPTLGQEEGDSDNGMTRSAISVGEITLKNGGDLSGIHRDTANANAGSLSMDAIPNLSETLAQQADRSAVAAQASAVVAQTVGDIATAIEKQQRKELNDLLLAAVKRGDVTVEEAMAIYEQPNPWGENQINRVLTHMLTQGLIAGIAGGDAGSGLQGAGGVLAGSLASQLAQSFNEQTGIQGALADFTKNIVSGAAGSLVGGAGGATAGSVDENNRQLHPDEMFFIFGLAHEFAKANGLTIEEAKAILIRGALYLNDAKWKEQYDKYYSTEVSKYLAAGNYVREAAAAVGFNLEINGVTQAAFTSTAEQYQNTLIGVKELATQRLMAQYLAYATIRGSAGFSEAEYLAALSSASGIGFQSGTSEAIEGMAQDAWKLATLSPMEALLLGLDGLNNLSQLSDPEKLSQAYNAAGDAAGDWTLAYLGLLDLYSAQGNGLAYGHTVGQTAGKVGTELASFFVGAGEIKSLLTAERALKLGTEAGKVGKVVEEVVDQAGKKLYKPGDLLPDGRIAGMGPGASLNNQAVREAANALKFTPVKGAPFNSHGQPVFAKGNRYITPDVDQHKGGVWKMFDQKGRRLGTYDEKLNRIGD